MTYLSYVVVDWFQTAYELPGKSSIFSSLVGRHETGIMELYAAVDETSQSHVEQLNSWCFVWQRLLELRWDHRSQWELSASYIELRISLTYGSNETMIWVTDERIRIVNYRQLEFRLRSYGIPIPKHPKIILDHHLLKLAFTWVTFRQVAMAVARIRLWWWRRDLSNWRQAREWHHAMAFVINTNPKPPVVLVIIITSFSGVATKGWWLAKSWLRVITVVSMFSTIHRLYMPILSSWKCKLVRGSSHNQDRRVIIKTSFVFDCADYCKTRWIEFRI